MHQAIRHNLLLAAQFVLGLTLASNLALAVCGQSYVATALVKNTGKHGDAQLINPWGLAYGPGRPVLAQR